MHYIHVVNGDLAARMLDEALQASERHDRVVVLRDDLAVGPLRAIDDSNATRIAFWQRVIGAAEHGLSQTVVDAFDASAATLRALTDDSDSEVVVWHAQNAADQLMLRRLAYRLRLSPQRLSEIGFATPQLANVDANRHHDLAVSGTVDASHASDVSDASDNSGAAAVAAATGDTGASAAGSVTTAMLRHRLHTAAPISMLRITRLALEWQELKQVDHELRRWRNNTFKSGLFADIDTALMELTSSEWQPYLHIAHRLRLDDPGSVASDALIAWRCRELASHGRIELDDDPVFTGSTRLRRTLGPAPHL